MFNFFFSRTDQVPMENVLETSWKRPGSRLELEDKVGMEEGQPGRNFHVPFFSAPEGN